ncbi:MAG: MOSC N-terminal beta barrel domain-containing protein [Planctomycetes bacterium]|nr:MOSC N-terminal beta barrel domain-containing protein [Planctomycetota bacterium]
MPHLARIQIFPIKSLDGLSVSESLVLPSGALEHDRRLVMLDPMDHVLNAKRIARIHLLRATFNLADNTVTLAAKGSHGTFRLAAPRTDLVTWLSEFFGVDLRLDENSAAGFPDDTENPGPTIISTATLETVAAWFPELTVDDIRRRFRANLEIDGVEPFWEERLYAAPGQGVPFQIGAVRLEGTNPCQRCVVPTRSPETGDRYPDFTKIFEERREQTFPAWANRVRFNHYYRLSVNTRLAPGGAGILRVGDQVQFPVPANSD